MGKWLWDWTGGFIRNCVIKGIFSNSYMGKQPVAVEWCIGKLLDSYHKYLVWARERENFTAWLFTKTITYKNWLIIEKIDEITDNAFKGHRYSKFIFLCDIHLWDTFVPIPVDLIPTKDHVIYESNVTRSVDSISKILYPENLASSR